MKYRVCVQAASAAILVLCLCGTARAAEPTAAPPADSTSGSGYFSDYFATVDKSQAEQPHWMTPLMTVTPRLEQEYRYDNQWQSRPHGADLTNYGVNKGVELIPLESVEVILGVPGYEVLNRPGKPSERGWADDTFTVKYRFASSNEEHGNYIFTGFVGISTPTGDTAFTADKTLYTTTLAAGKGWGTRAEGFDVQTTLAATFPSGDEKTIGIPVVWNLALQGHVFNDRFWPEVELNYTHFNDGPNDGKDQAILTVGAIFGRFPIAGRLRLAVGAGYQQALTKVHTYNHAGLLTLRLPF